MTQVVAFAIGKGGAGKTSTTANIGALLARFSARRVLLVTLDSQDNLGEELGYTFSDSSDHGAALAHSLLTGEPLQPAVTAIRPRLDVITCGHLAGEPLVLRMHTAGIPDDQLARCLAPIAADYDWILIDCPPNAPTMQRQALAAAQYLMVPCQVDLSSVKGIRMLAAEYVRAKQSNPELTLLGVFLFNVPTAATAMRARVEANLREELGGIAPLLGTPIRSAIVPAEVARGQGIPVVELAKQSGAPASAAGVADDYENLAAEMINLITQEQSS